MNRETKFKIFQIMDSINESVSFIRDRINKNLVDENVFAAINIIIDAFVAINNEIRMSINNIEFNKINDVLANDLVFFINGTNNDKYNIDIASANKLLNSIDIWEKALIKNIKYKIIVYGINNFYSILSIVLNPNLCEIIGFIDETGKFKDIYFNHKQVIDLRKINIDYDFIFILTENKQLLNNYLLSGVALKENPVFDFYKWFQTYFDYEFYRSYLQFIKSDKKYECIISGLSYHEVGIDINYLKKRSFNFAISSQDLFYDYLTVKNVFNFKTAKETIKYVIIGLSYYSFQYDLSKTKNEFGRLRPNIYYPYYNNLHNYEDSVNSILFYKTFDSLSKYILYCDFKEKLFYHCKNNFDENWNKFVCNKFNSAELSDKDRKREISLIQRDSDKNYPKSVEENKIIFKNYLELLVNNKVKPIVVICPVTDIYRKYFAKGIKNEFISIINEFKEKYDFQFLDFYETDGFNDSDFYNSSHLNPDGSRKFTKILNEKIKW